VVEEKEEKSEERAFQGSYVGKVGVVGGERRIRVEVGESRRGLWEVVVYDGFGREVYRGVGEGSPLWVDVGGLSAGVYYVSAWEVETRQPIPLRALVE